MYQTEHTAETGARYAIYHPWQATDAIEAPETSVARVREQTIPTERPPRLQADNSGIECKGKLIWTEVRMCLVTLQNAWVHMEWWVQCFRNSYDVNVMKLKQICFSFDIMYTMYTYTYTAIATNNIDFISFNPLTTCFGPYGPSSGDYSNILCTRIKNHHITTSHPFLTSMLFTIVLFLLCDNSTARETGRASFAPFWNHPFDRLCGLVVRVPRCRSRGPGSIPGATRFSEK
jgi:hypothetical protein